MLHKRNVKEVISDFHRQYSIIMPDADSVAVARDIWQDWKLSGNAPPDIDAIAKDYSLHENGFFYELVAVAEKMEGINLGIHHCQFSLDRYNAYAFTATDGYIILVDDIFFQILYFLIHILLFDAQGAIEDPDEIRQAKAFVQEIVSVNYIQRRRIDFSRQSIFHTLVKRDYELAEFANYLFHSIKAFILSHEIGHHVLRHTTGKYKKIFAANGHTMEMEVDQRRIECEFEADSYGYRLFNALSDTTDETVFYAWCKYKFPFAPLLLFDIFRSLDDVQASLQGKLLAYTTHPHPDKRIKALTAGYAIYDEDPLYLLLKESLGRYLSDSAGQTPAD